ncbi:hypothetical protein CHS0354_000883 [Potamilus streckersoni]|uniref:Uncharacterized protein n=1 Tax=Potamilus streckersoni TaxID=2493646 RepID=A0AAE0VMS8_9BIVA|nr:hypothetical protein CHS0354_000883 [Potamilus streckersoni]
MDYRWYNVEKRNIPNDYASFSFGMCSTYHPVWMNGTVPDETDGVVERIACTRSDREYCASPQLLEVRNCGTHMIYKLNQTIGLSAYCFVSRWTHRKSASTCFSLANFYTGSPDDTAISFAYLIICVNVYSKPAERSLSID